MRVAEQLRSVSADVQRLGWRYALVCRFDRLLAPRARGYISHSNLFTNKRGLEIGGPTLLFKAGKMFPVYGVAGRIDNCNHAPHTVWEGNISEGATFRFHPDRQPGSQYIADAVALTPIADQSYDFVLSSHTLEHVANPIRALREWRRVLKPGGALVLIVPHKRWNFEHRRPVTPLPHMLDDFERETQEDDDTHLEEFLTLHDLSRDPVKMTFDEFTARTEGFVQNRCIHHHVFDQSTAAAVVEKAGFRVASAETRREAHIIVVAISH